MKNNEHEKIPVAVYCRVSTKEAEQLKSLKHQEQFFRELFEEGDENARKRFNYADHELIEVYVEEGRTGTKLSRPEFDRMIADAGIDKNKIEGEHYAVVGNPKFKRILVKNTSRFARNTSVNLLIKTLTKVGVYIDFVDIGLSTENDTDTITLGVLQLLDEVESKDKSKKTSFGMKQGAKNKNILCTNKIYGYEYHPMPENRLKIIPEQAEVVRRMFEMYVNEGIGAHRIAKIFFKEGILNKNNKPLAECTIRGMLANEKYCGIVARMKYDTGEVFNKHSYAQIRPFEERAEYQFENEKKCPAIISKELFYKAQEIRTKKVQHIEQVGKKRKVVDGKIQYNGGLNYGTSPYAEKIKCANCGKQYRAQQTKKYAGGRKERYYRCVGKMGIGDKEKMCTNPNVSETYLNTELSSEKYSGMLAESFITAQRILAELSDDIFKALVNENISNELAQLEAEHKKYQIQIDRANKLYIMNESELNIESVNKIRKPIIEKDEKVLAKIRELNKSKADRLNDLHRINESMDELKNRLSEIYELETISEVDIDNDGTVIVNEVFYADDYGVYNADYSVPPKKQFTREEVLNDINKILVHGSKELTVEFKTFAEVEQLVKKHEHIMTERTLGIFNELKARGWNRALCYEHSDFWL